MGVPMLLAAQLSSNVPHCLCSDRQRVPRVRTAALCAALCSISSSCLLSSLPGSLLLCCLLGSCLFSQPADRCGNTRLARSAAQNSWHTALSILQASWSAKLRRKHEWPRVPGQDAGQPHGLSESVYLSPCCTVASHMEQAMADRRQQEWQLLTCASPLHPPAAWPPAPSASARHGVCALHPPRHSGACSSPWSWPPSPAGTAHA